MGNGVGKIVWNTVCFSDGLVDICWCWRLVNPPVRHAFLQANET